MFIAHAFAPLRGGALRRPGTVEGGSGTMRLLKAAWAGWKALAHRIGVFNTKLLLFAFYYLALGPISLVARVFQPDPLGKRIQPGSLYVPVKGQPDTLERARRQF